MVDQQNVYTNPSGGGERDGGLGALAVILIVLALLAIGYLLFANTRNDTDGDTNIDVQTEQTEPATPDTTTPDETAPGTSDDGTTTDPDSTQ